MMVWHNKLDGKFTCRVVRNGAAGILTVHTPGGERILSKPVSLAFGARFGPDAADVADWQDRCVEAVDEYVKGRGDAED